MMAFALYSPIEPRAAERTGALCAGPGDVTLRDLLEPPAAPQGIDEADRPALLTGWSEPADRDHAEDHLRGPTGTTSDRCGKGFTSGSAQRDSVIGPISRITNLLRMLPSGPDAAVTSPRCSKPCLSGNLPPRRRGADQRRPASSPWDMRTGRHPQARTPVSSGASPLNTEPCS
jgi:hypothetical protein